MSSLSSERKGKPRKKGRRRTEKRCEVSVYFTISTEVSSRPVGKVNDDCHAFSYVLNRTEIRRRLGNAKQARIKHYRGTYRCK